MYQNKTLFFVGWFLPAIIFWACGETSSLKQSTALPYYITPDFTPHWPEENGQSISKTHTIPDFSFYNQDGEKITQATFEGKIYVADFFFTTCPGICPKLTKNMGMLQEAFKEDQEILLLSHTVTPWIDSIPRLKMYAEDQGVLADKWHLVTGEQVDIYQIARQSYFAEMEVGINKSVEEFLHTENFILVDKQKRIRGVYNGTLPLEVKQLIEDIKVLKREG